MDRSSPKNSVIIFFCSKSGSGHQNSLIANILRNIFFCASQKKK